MDLSPEARRVLLAVARRAIEIHLARQAPAQPHVAEDLREPAGAFVTLSRRADGALRGCVGYIEPLFPLVETVARAAVAAATADGRFDAVTVEELPALVLDISVLGPVRPIVAEAVEVGRHGLIVRCGGRSGLLLPQVATEHGWDRDTFLDQTCRKAGLPKGTWQRPDAEVLGFMATVFGDG